MTAKKKTTTPDPRMNALIIGEIIETMDVEWDERQGDRKVIHITERGVYTLCDTNGDPSDVQFHAWEDYRFFRTSEVL